MIDRLKKAASNPWSILCFFMIKIGRLVPDIIYLSILYKAYMGKWINWKSPESFNEKLQWLKIHDRKPIYTVMVDKYEAKKYVSKIIGIDYIIPTIGIYNSFDEIDFTKLPNQFVIKCTHDSGGTYVCRDKSMLNLGLIRKQIRQSLKKNYFYRFREWPYKNVEPRIIVEQYMEDESGELVDYKFSCFNGYAHNTMVCYDRSINDTKFYFFNRKWELLRYNKRGLLASSDFTLPKPKDLDKMFDIADKLSQNIPYARIDLYNINGHIYFGEITFYPQSGFDANLLEETDKLFGNLIKLEKYDEYCRFSN